MAHISGTKISPNMGFVQEHSNNINFHYTVKPVLMITFLKQPPVLNEHVVVLPSGYRSNFSLYSDQLYNATNDHLNDVSGILL